MIENIKHKTYPILGVIIERSPTEDRIDTTVAYQTGEHTWSAMSIGFVDGYSDEKLINNTLSFCMAEDEIWAKKMFQFEDLYWEFPDIDKMFGQK